MEKWKELMQNQSGKKFDTKIESDFFVDVEGSAVSGHFAEVTEPIPELSVEAADIRRQLFATAEASGYPVHSIPSNPTSTSCERRLYIRHLDTK